MQTNLVKEIYNVQNPALGSVILWRFVCGYYAHDNKPVPFPLLFVVLPVVFREDLRAVIKSTQKGKGLSKVSEKLFKDKKKDNLYSINNTAIVLRPLTLDSFTIGVSAKLFYLEKSTALVYPLVQTKVTNISDSTKMLLDSAEKLGGWCAELSLLEVCNWLKVRF